MDNNKTIVIQAKPSATAAEENNDLNAIKEFFYVCLEGWKWFVLSLLVFTTCAFLYLQTKEPLYTRSASVHIKEDSRKGSIGNIGEEFSALGIGNTSMSVNNEVVAFNSLELAEQVVRELNLDISYKADNGMRKKVLFGETLPIKTAFKDIKEDDHVSFTVELLGHGKFNISDFKCSREGIDFNSVASVEIIDSNLVGERIYVTRHPLSLATDIMHGRLTTIQNNNKNSVIDITYEDESIERAEAVINTLIAEYNKNWIKDKNELGVLTSQFINERIKAIQQELGGVDADIAKYKSTNLIAAPDQAANLLLSQASQSDQQIMAISNQIQMCGFLHDYIADEANSRKLIPANIGIGSTDVTTLVSTYNQQMLQRNTYAENSSELNPLVQNLEAELKAQRSAILQSLANVKKDLEAQMQASTKTMRQSTSKLSSAPAQEKNLLSMDRQQKVKEALYLFLLQKREENELSQAFSAYNTRIISRPMGSKMPTSPVPLRIYLVALISACILPIVVLYIRELFNTKVRGRKDLDKLSVPFLGEIPEMKTKILRPFDKLRTGQAQDRLKTKIPLLVEQGKRDVVNEAFRVVRTNLGFMLNPNCSEKRKVVQITSANPGSGKTFLSINLAASFCLQNKTKAIILDLDIRKASLSKAIGSPEYGVSDYLGGFKNDWKELIRKMDDKTMVDVLPVGHIPPNPAELLQSERLQTLIEELKLEYDIIFLDMPPAEVVADVTITKHLADLTLYVVRAGNMDRSILPIIERYYQDKTFNNLAVILNGSEIQSHRYGYGRYGYGYGYYADK